MKNLLGLLKNHYKNVGIIAVLSLILIPSFAQDAEIKNADRLIDHDKRKQAVEVLQKATTTYPTAAKLFYYLGQAQLYAGDQNGAKASFDAGVKADPKEPLNYAGQGQILILEKKGAAQAKPLLDKALNLGKKNVANLQAIAKAYMADKATSKDALPLLQKAKEINPNDPKTSLLLGDYYLMENQGGSCASAYEDATALDPSSGAPLYKHALLFMRTKNIPVVEEDLKKSIAADPEYALAHKELGELYYLKKDGANAVKHYEIYLSLTDSPEKKSGFIHAFYLFMAKNYAKANEIFKSLSEKPDVAPSTLKFYARSLSEAGNLEESQKIFEKYLNGKDSLEATDFNSYASLLLKQKKDSLAAIAFQNSLNLDQNQPTVHQTLIDYYWSKKKYPECENACRAAIKIRKTPFFNDYFKLGQSLYLEHKYSQADSAFAKTIELQPKITLPYVWAARSKGAQDEELKEGLAKPFYEKVIEIGEADKEKNKKDLSDAYKYMGSYYMIKQDYKTAKGYWQKVLELYPEDENSKEAIKIIDTPPTQNPPKRKPTQVKH
jgi:cytochrome c-type biogenesis protein CcmH/NrfG